MNTGSESGAESAARADDQAGVLVGIACPECHGSIWLQEVEGVQSLRCRIGHAFSLDAFTRAHGESTEEALWSAVRVVEEQAALARLLAAAAATTDEQEQFDESSASLDRTARDLRAIVEQVRPATPPAPA